MRKISKNLTKARALVEPRPYVLADAVPLLQKAKYAKFDETVDLTMRLGVDPKHADQMVRGTVVLPHGLGKSKIVAVIASGDKIKDAQAQRQVDSLVELRILGFDQEWDCVDQGVRTGLNERARLHQIL
jgi:ribosomal protein L1